MAYKNTHKGFSLVELSIVLVIIGLIVGGIMAGNALIDSARLNSVIADVEQFSKATDSFEATYGGLPGDIASVAALPTVTPTPVAGNGNGAIDSATEALQFWYQLMAAQLIPGNYDGTSTYVPASSGITGGVPGGKMPESGYTVTTTSAGLVITLGTFSSSSSTLATLTPAEALAIDQKLDDGKPTTGIVQAAEGTGSASSSCVSGTAYASTTNDTPTCILKFTISRKAVISTSASTVTCSGIPAGTSRISTSSTCPTGYTGHVIESCIATNNNGTWTGAWVDIRQSCSQITCGNGYVAGNQQTVACPSGYPNVSFTQTCQSNGLWKTDTASTPCGTPIISSALAGQSCTYGASLFLSCPAGQSGIQKLSCLSTNLWPSANTSYTSSCSDITCSGTAIGANSGTTLACPSGYSSGSVTQSCTLSGALKPTTNNCIPTYSACTPGATQATSCPSGYIGNSTQTCSSSGYWSTESDTCVPITCGTQPIGAYRRALGAACPKGSTGTVYEVCDSDGTWKAVTSNCSVMQCPQITDSASTAYWIASNPGTWNLYPSSCSAGTNAAARDCLYTGSWGSIKGSCAITPCPAITTASSTTAYATWPETAASSTGTLANGTCMSGYTGTPTRSCTTSGTAGVWGTISGTCTALQTPSGSYACTCSNCYYVAGTTNFSCSCKTYAGSWVTSIKNAASYSYSFSNKNGVLSANDYNYCSGYIYPPCAAITTASSSTGYATWPQTNTNTSATGTCQSGYTGTPTRSCSSSGAWGTISNPCAPPCPAITTASSSTAYATWPQTNYGQTATGTCQSGYSGAPTPTRSCGSNSTWGTISGTCIQACTASTSSCSKNSQSTCGKYYIASSGIPCYWAGTYCAKGGAACKNVSLSTPNCSGTGVSSCSSVANTTSSNCSNYYNYNADMQCGWNGSYCSNAGSNCK